MSKIATNNYENAFKQAKAYEEASGVKAGTLTGRIPKEINKADGKNHYHVLLVKKRHDAANERYILAGNVQTFGKGPAFDKISKNFKTQGFASLIIVHDPNNNPVEQNTTSDLKQHEKSAIARQIEKEEKEAMDKRIAERTKEAEQKASEAKSDLNPSTQAGSEKNPSKPKNDKLTFDGVEITEANVDDFIKDNKVDVKDAKTPEGKLAIVKKFIEGKTKK